MKVNRYPKKNASVIASARLGIVDQPHQVASTMPSTSPMAQPVRQCRVALTAVFQDSLMSAPYTP